MFRWRRIRGSGHEEETLGGSPSALLMPPMGPTLSSMSYVSGLMLPHLGLAPMRLGHEKEWFAEAEAIFAANRISGESTRFKHLYSALPQDLLLKFRDLLLEPGREYSSTREAILRSSSQISCCTSNPEIGRKSRPSGADCSNAHEEQEVIDTNNDDMEGYCEFHQLFGEKATSCVRPCSWRPRGKGHQKLDHKENLANTSSTSTQTPTSTSVAVLSENQNIFNVPDRFY